jgi:hypothetical protein
VRGPPQTDAPHGLPVISGSPDSLVAPTFEPVVEPLVPEIVCELANMSFAGPPPPPPETPPETLQFSVTLPVCRPDTGPSKPSTAILYVVPEVALKVTELVRSLPLTSSFSAIVVSEPTLGPG